MKRHKYSCERIQTSCWNRSDPEADLRAKTRKVFFVPHSASSAIAKFCRRGERPVWAVIDVSLSQITADAACSPTTELIPRLEVDFVSPMPAPSRKPENPAHRPFNLSDLTKELRNWHHNHSSDLANTSLDGLKKVCNRSQPTRSIKTRVKNENCCCLLRRP